MNFRSRCCKCRKYQTLWRTLMNFILVITKSRTSVFQFSAPEEMLCGQKRQCGLRRNECKTRSCLRIPYSPVLVLSRWTPPNPILVLSGGYPWLLSRGIPLVIGLTRGTPLLKRRAWPSIPQKGPWFRDQGLPHPHGGQTNKLKTLSSSYFVRGR